MRKILVAIFAGALTCVAGVVHAGTITIGSYNGSVSSRPFTGGGFSNLIADLQNPANFGPSGTNSNSVVIAPEVSDANAGSLAGYNVFVMDEVTSLPAGNAAALAAWVQAGGRLIIVNDSGGSGAPGGNAILSLIDGSSIGSGIAGVSGANGGSITASGLSSNGPFGNLVGGTIATTPGSPLVPGPDSYIVGTSGGANFLMETLFGSGAVLTTADVSFQNFFVPPSPFPGNPNNALLFENFISTSVFSVPEPATLATLGVGFTGIATLRRRRQRR